MKRKATIGSTALAAVVCAAGSAYAQDQPAAPMQDPSRDNLVHPEGYETCDLGDVASVEVVGCGAQALVLLPGWGFDGAVFAPIVDAESKTYTYIIITPAGASGSPAPPMPEAGASYGERTWWRAFEEAVWDELENRGVEDPVLVAYLDAAQSAVMLANQHRDRVRGIICVAGLPQMEFQQPFPKGMRAQIIDTNVAQAWFKTVTQETWNNGMGSPEWYSPVEEIGAPLYEASLISSIPTMVRYYCEHWATDIMDEAASIECPVLAIQPDPDDGADVQMYPDFVARALINPWTAIAEANDSVTTRILPGARMGLMQTHTEEILGAIDDFVESLGS